MKGYDEGIGGHEGESEQEIVYKETWWPLGFVANAVCTSMQKRNKKIKSKSKSRADHLLSCIPGPIMLLLP